MPLGNSSSVVVLLCWPLIDVDRSVGGTSVQHDPILESRQREGCTGYICSKISCGSISDIPPFLIQEALFYCWTSKTGACIYVWLRSLCNAVGPTEGTGYNIFQFFPVPYLILLLEGPVLQNCYSHQGNNCYDSNHSDDDGHRRVPGVLPFHLWERGRKDRPTGRRSVRFHRVDWDTVERGMGRVNQFRAQMSVMSQHMPLCLWERGCLRVAVCLCCFVAKDYRRTGSEHISDCSLIPGKDFSLLTGEMIKPVLQLLQ